MYLLGNYIVINADNATWDWKKLKILINDINFVQKIHTNVTPKIK